MQKLMTQGRVLKAMFKDGAQIVTDHVMKPEPKTTHRLSTNHKLIHQGLLDMLLAENLIKPNNDGLPGLGISQTYSLVRSSDTDPSPLISSTNQ